MIFREAVNAILQWYATQSPVVFTVTCAQQLGSDHFRVSVHQQFPVDTYRTFEMKPGDVADCWNVEEVQL